MANYVVSIPENIPANLFGNLGGTVNNQRRATLSRGYSRLQKMTSTVAETPVKALANSIFRVLSNDSNQVVPKDILTMLEGNVDSYVFEVPAKDNYGADGKRISERTAKSFRESELAIEMGHARNCRPEDCYHEAARLMDVYRGR